ncbi:MAG: methylenetetrahydrofolate reductase [Deltaproteobacteria bacterium]|nr:methylenetetrahydrofolate reductase [Deltaproteobacteria bacterium]
MQTEKFTITVEVVPPAGPHAGGLLSTLHSLKDLPIDGFSVATNPVAKPRMSAMAVCALIQQKTGRPAILHCTTRDHNRLSLQSLLWGAVALGIETVLASTGDFVALEDRSSTTDVRDADVFDLVKMTHAAGLRTGVVLDPRPETNGLKQAVERLKRKIESGAHFAVTQPLYDADAADELAEAVRYIGIPVVMGILPLRSHRHAEFLHHKVAGIAIPSAVRDRMRRAENPVAEGARNAIDILNLARERFAGACLMPPFDRYETLSDILLENPKP